MTTEQDQFADIQAAVAVIRRAIGDRKPTVGLILGSGLGGFADQLEDAIAIEYGDLPGFPKSHVVGHKGRLVVGKRGGAVCPRRGWLPQRVRVERWSSRLPMDGVWRGQSWQYDHSVLPYPVTELPSLAPHHR